MTITKHLLLACILGFCALLLGCTKYDPPPVPELPLPDLGTWEVGQSLLITFSEPIAKDSLRLKVWPAGPEDRTIEGATVPGVVPALDSCTVKSCGASALELAADGLSATLSLKEPVFGKAKLPWILEVETGLADPAGRATGAPYEFEFQFAPASRCGGNIDVEFEAGDYLLFSQIEQPAKVALIMFADTKVLSDGRVSFVGSKATNIEGAAKNTSDPDELMIDLTEKGFAIFVNGCVSVDDDTGELFMSTDPLDVELSFGPIKVILAQLRLTGTVSKHPETGNDRIEGTISYSELVLDLGSGDPFKYEPGNATFYMDKMNAEQRKEDAGDLCGDLCDQITAQCTPPEDFPEPDFCAEPTE